MSKENKSNSSLNGMRELDKFIRMHRERRKDMILNPDKYVENYNRLNEEIKHREFIEEYRNSYNDLIGDFDYQYFVTITFRNKVKLKKASEYLRSLMTILNYDIVSKKCNIVNSEPLKGYIFLEYTKAKIPHFHILFAKHEKLDRFKTAKDFYEFVIRKCDKFKDVYYPKMKRDEYGNYVPAPVIYEKHFESENNIYFKRKDTTKRIYKIFDKKGIHVGDDFSSKLRAINYCTKQMKNKSKSDFIWPFEAGDIAWVGC